MSNALDNIINGLSNVTDRGSLLNEKTHHIKDKINSRSRVGFLQDFCLNDLELAKKQIRSGFTANNQTVTGFSGQLQQITPKVTIATDDDDPFI